MFDFVTIDFETANHHRGSACAVGMTRVRSGGIVESVSWLMQPPEQYAGFEFYNTMIHGINEQMVFGEPHFVEVLPRIIEFIGSDVVCAHNARFDVSVLTAASIAVGQEPTVAPFICTLTAARRCLELPSYRLPFVADALGVRLDEHDEPGADARAVAMIVPRLSEVLGVSDLDAMAQVVRTAPTPRPLPSIDAPHRGADPDHSMYGRVIVFTGALSTMTRSIAHEECLKVGALPEGNVTKATNILVVGDLNPAHLVPGCTTSQKAQKAFTLRAAGQDLEVMTEYDFLSAL